MSDINVITVLLAYLITKVQISLGQHGPSEPLLVHE